MRPWRWIVPTILALGSCAGGDPNAAPGPPPPKPKAEKGVVRLDHLRIDLVKRQIVLDTEVCLRSGPLELLVCKAGTKEYESILSTEALGAHLHAGLLALGLTPGLPAEWTGTDDDARLLPPRGPELAITLKWKDAAGRTRQAEAGTWLKQARPNAELPKRWVFIGSSILPDNRYWADVDGDVISVANFASAVIDVPFESTKENAALEFAAEEQAIPPLGTAVEVVISPLPDADRSPYARAIVDIDANGRMQTGGRSLDAAELTRWAEQFASRHVKGRVILRADARALVDDVQKAMSALRRGAVRDIEVERLRPAGAVLPRSPEQVRRELAAWAEKFRSPEEYIVPPAEDAAATIEQIEQELRQVEAQKAMLVQYRDALRAMLKGSAPAETADGN